MLPDLLARRTAAVGFVPGWPGVRREKRPTRWPWCSRRPSTPSPDPPSARCRSLPRISTRTRSPWRGADHTRRRSPATSRRNDSSASSPSQGDGYLIDKTHPRNGAVRPARRDPGPAVHQARHPVVSQPDNLFQRAQLQRRLMPLFHYSLRRGGVLVLGGSETVGRSQSSVHAAGRQIARLPARGQWRRSLAIDFPDPVARLSRCAHAGDIIAAISRPSRQSAIACRPGAAAGVLPAGGAGQ